MDETATAYHEAGHAVACYALWRPFRYVTIIPEDDPSGGSLGHVLGAPTPDADGQCFEGDVDAMVRDRAVICLAGHASERKLRGDRHYTQDEVFAQLTPDDLLVVEMACRSCTAVVSPLADGTLETDISPALDEMMAGAVGIVEDNWGAVSAVAQKLLTNRTLTDLEVYEIVSAAPWAMSPGCD